MRNHWGISSLATRLYCDLILLYIEKSAPILDRDLWPIVGHLVHAIATRGRLVLMDVFPTELLVYRSAIYPQWKTSKYGLGGMLGYFQLLSCCTFPSAFDLALDRKWVFNHCLMKFQILIPCSIPSKNILKRHCLKVQFIRAWINHLNSLPTKEHALVKTRPHLIPNIKPIVTFWVIHAFLSMYYVDIRIGVFTF